MKRWLGDVDRLLRGEATRPEMLVDKRDIEIDVRRLLPAIVVLCMIYGLCMGSYSLLKTVPPELTGGSDRFWQLVASTIKTPLLFLLTLLVTLPSLYVLNALIGSRLRPAGLCRLLLAALAVNAAVLASLGPIVAFFSLSTNSHPFVVLLNVTMFALSGVLGLAFLLQTLHRITTADRRRSVQKLATASQEAKQAPQESAPTETTSPSAEADQPRAARAEPQTLPPAEQTGSEAWLPARRDESGALEMPEGETLAKHTRLVFRCWVVLFALVGAQMGWVMRPFIGSPELPFTWFRERQSNFFSGVLNALGKLLFGEG